jgi:phage tail sheath protein FI
MDLKKKKIPGRAVTPGVYIQELSSGVRPLEGIPTSITAFVGFAKTGALNQPISISSYLEYERIFGGMSNASQMSFAVNDYFINGGKQAIIVRVEDKVPSGNPDTLIIGNESSKTGLYALDKADLFSILCIPPPDENNDIGMDVISLASVYCEKRRAMLVINSPKTWLTAGDAQEGMLNMQRTGGIIKKNAALYFPRIRKPNPLRNNKVETFAPCGAVAGVINRIDLTQGVWKAPAGTNAVIHGINGFSVALSDMDLDNLNRLECNCLRAFPGAGNVIWGGRTLAGFNDSDAEWKYIPVRRLALYLEESIYRGIKWVVFEPNGESLWARIRSYLESFMNGLFRAGAFQGTKPADAYFVKCDKETITQSDVARGIVNIMVGFAPLKPAEFMIIKIHLAAAS